MSSTYTLPNYVDGRWIVTFRRRHEIRGLCIAQGLQCRSYGPRKLEISSKGGAVSYDTINGYFDGWMKDPIYQEFTSLDIAHLHAPWFFALCGFFWVLGAPATRFSSGMESALRQVERLIDEGTSAPNAIVAAAQRTGYMTSEIMRAMQIRTAETLGQTQLAL